MKSAFLGGAYASRSLPLNAQTCINLYAEPNEGGGEIGAFFGTAGLRKVATFNGEHRGSVTANGRLYVVHGNAISIVAPDFGHAVITTIPSDKGPVGMAFNTIQVVVAHPDGWTVIDLNTGAINEVPDAPKTCDVTFIDNYGVFAMDNGAYGWTAIADFSSIDPLAYASAEGSPDKILATVADHRQLFLFGENTIEVATVGTDPDLPFNRGTFIEQGILAPKSACKIDNTIFWLGRNEKGQGIIYRVEGDTPMRVSTFAIEQAIAGYVSPETCTAFTYQQDGHHFVVFNFDEATWCYDINTQTWHQRAWREPATGQLKRWRGQTHSMFNGQHVVGDYADGRLYVLDIDHFRDDNDLIYRERTWAQVENENKYMVFHRGELIADMGMGLDGSDTPEESDPTAWLSVSKDGGRTWGSERPRSLGRIGEYTKRAVWWRMGIARTFWCRLRTTSATRIAWRGFNVQGEGAGK